MTGASGEDTHMRHPYLMQTETQKMAGEAMTMIRTLNTLILTVIPSQAIPTYPINIQTRYSYDIHTISIQYPIRYPNIGYVWINYMD
jgi:hypothetical protein